MRIIGFLILSMLPVMANAAHMYKKVDISPMVEHFRKQVVTLNKSVTTYNWAPRSGAFWDKERAQNDPALLNVAKNLAGSFWRGYGSKEGSTNMYGYGLYTAVDPVATQSYGEPTWLLTQIRFPVGTRMLDFGNSNTVDISDAALLKATEEIEEKFACPPNASPDVYFMNGGNKLDSKCQQLIYEVFNNILQIDAFAYGYNQTNFKDCDNGMYLGQRAFVVTRPEAMRVDDVHFYTTDSRLNEEERVRIQTLFLKSITEQNLNMQPFLDLIAQYLDQHDDRELQTSNTVCDGDSCVITIQFCDAKNTCEALKLPPLPRPGGPLITLEEANKTKLLWPDLIGKSKSPTISTWLKNNKFGCSGELPYATQ